jgi:hypothetical protein
MVTAVALSSFVMDNEPDQRQTDLHGNESSLIRTAAAGNQWVVKPCCVKTPNLPDCYTNRGERRALHQHVFHCDRSQLVPGCAPKRLLPKVRHLSAPLCRLIANVDAI